MGLKKKAISKKNKAEATVDHQGTQDLEDGTVTTEVSQNKQSGKRSVVGMYKVVVKKAMGQKCTVRYTSSGTPTGETRHTLQSYIGMLARNRVPINIKRWADVDPELKDKIWLDVLSTFEIAPECKLSSLKSAATKWRQFKTLLTNQYVLPFIDNKKHLKKPPKKYSFVGREEWKDFVKQRSTKEWMEHHNVQSERSKKRKYHHRLSRKGYIGLEEELIEKLPPGEVIDRAVMWKKARERKDGQLDDDVAVVAEKIDDLLQKKIKGELEVSGSNDVLTKALETPEHTGRVRGVGGFNNPTNYFNLPKQNRVRITKAELLRRDREREAEAKVRHMEVEALREQVSQLQSMVTGKVPQIIPVTPISDKGSNFKDVRAEDTDQCQIMPSPKKGIDGCELAVDTIDNVVAVGRVYDEAMKTKIVRPGCVRVSVDMCIKEDALLPFPIEDITMVCGSIGNHVDWPENLVIRSSSKDKSIKKKRTGPIPFVYHSNVPTQCKMLYKYAKTTMIQSNLTYHVPLHESIFGGEKQLYILPEAIIALLEYGWLGANIISAYMTILYHVIADKQETRLYCFIDPDQTRYFERPAFSPYILARLRQGDPETVFFAPHNPEDHWILSIVYNGKVLVLDPQPKPLRYRAWENALLNVVKEFNAERGIPTKNLQVTSLKGVPKQPGGWECAYYVMRYMRDIINDDTLDFERKWAVKTKSYTMPELNALRLELADFIQSLD